MILFDYPFHFWGLFGEAFCLSLGNIILKTCKFVFCEPIRYFLRKLLHLLLLLVGVLCFHLWSSCWLLRLFRHCLRSSSWKRKKFTLNIVFRGSYGWAGHVFKVGHLGVSLSIHPSIYLLKLQGSWLLVGVVILQVILLQVIVSFLQIQSFFDDHTFVAVLSCAFAVCSSNFLRY